MKVLFIYVFTSLFILNCSKSTDPELDLGTFVVDKQEIVVEKYFEDSTLFYDTKFTFIYHLENESGNLNEYQYSLHYLPNGLGLGNGWDDRSTSRRRGMTPKFLDIKQKDTLEFNLKIGTSDTLQTIRYQFYILGYYYDEPKFVSELEDQQNLDAFFYFCEDTLN